MANQDAPFGFRPTRHLTGGEVRTNEYAIAANFGTSIYTNQPVVGVTEVAFSTQLILQQVQLD